MTTIPNVATLREEHLNPRICRQRNSHGADGTVALNGRMFCYPAPRSRHRAMSCGRQSRLRFDAIISRWLRRSASREKPLRSRACREIDQSLLDAFAQAAMAIDRLTQSLTCVDQFQVSRCLRAIVPSDSAPPGSSCSRRITVSLAPLSRRIFSRICSTKGRSTGRVRWLR